MASSEQIEQILQEALAEEKSAEILCQNLLLLFKENEYLSKIKQIENDEIQHQKIVRELISLIKK